MPNWAISLLFVILLVGGIPLYFEMRSRSKIWKIHQQWASSLQGGRNDPYLTALLEELLEAKTQLAIAPADYVFTRKQLKKRIIELTDAILDYPNEIPKPKRKQF